MTHYEITHTRGRHDVRRISDGTRSPARLCSCRTESGARAFLRAEIVCLLRAERNASLEPLRHAVRDLESVVIYGLGTNAIRAREEHDRQLGSARVALHLAHRQPTEAEVDARFAASVRYGFKSRG